MSHIFPLKTLPCSYFSLQGYLFYPFKKNSWFSVSLLKIISEALSFLCFHTEKTCNFCRDLDGLAQPGIPIFETCSFMSYCPKEPDLVHKRGYFKTEQIIFVFVCWGGGPRTSEGEK